MGSEMCIRDRNMGDSRSILEAAVQALDEMKNTKVEKVSTFITTPPYGVTDQPDFLNGCLKLSTLLYPEELLKELNRIEKEAGRERIIHWGPRTLDLDIIFYDDLVAETDALCIPHVEMHKRAFVLEPLHEIAPYKRHPVYGKLSLIHISEPTRRTPISYAVFCLKKKIKKIKKTRN